MGVDAKAYIGSDVTPEFIAYALAKAFGVTPPSKDTPNVFDARGYIRCNQAIAPASYWNLDIPGQPWVSLHHANDGNPFGSTWMLMGRSTEERIAALEAVCRTFGGMLVWQDSDGVGQWFQSPERRDFTAFEAAVFALEKAPVTKEHRSHAAYQ